MSASRESKPPRSGPPRDTATALLTDLEGILGDAPCPDCAAPEYERLAAKLRDLHAWFRAHQATDFFSPRTNPAVAAAPQLADEFTRLSDEHRHIMGSLDVLIRNVDSMPDRPTEDRDVFLLRVRELIAVLRRHEAEEERLFLLALWHETGGEG